MMLYRVLGFVVLACCVSFPCATGFAAPSAKHAAATPALPQTGAADNWTHHGAAADESGFSRLTQINAQNIDKLGLTSSLVLETK